MIDNKCSILFSKENELKLNEILFQILNKKGQAVIEGKCFDDDISIT